MKSLDLQKLNEILSEEMDYVCIISTLSGNPMVVVKSVELEKDLESFFKMNNIDLPVVRALIKR